MTLILLAVLAVTATASWLLPVLNQPTVAFGVRVPATRYGSPVIAAEHEQYRRRVAGACLVSAAAAVVLMATNWWWPTPAALGILLAVTAFAYLQAHRTIAAAKRDEGWYDSLSQVIVVDTTLRTRPEPFPWRWAAPAVLIIAATVAVGVIRYPGLPAVLTVHVDFSGAADRQVSRSVLVAFSPVMIQVLLTALLVAVTLAGFTARAELDPADPDGAALRHRRYVSGFARRLLVLAASVDATVAVTAWWMWSGTSSGPLLGTAAATIAAGVIPLIHYAVRVGPGGSRMSAGPTVPAGPSRRDDDAHWRLGLVYVNPNDPAVMVPQRVGVGWTLNLARPLSWLALLALLTVPAGAAGLLILIPR